MTSITTSESCWPAYTDIEADGKLVIGRIEDFQSALMSQEQHLADGVTPARLRELQAGRTIARYAIRALGGNAAPIQMAASGAPAWPANYCGSLSHTNRHVAALVGLSSKFAAVGVDIDDGRPLGNAVSNVAHVDEIELVREMGGHGLSSPECVIFSIKEALFKCQCPLTGDEALEFLHVRLTSGLNPGSLMVEVVDSNRHQLAQLTRRLKISVRVINGITAACVIAEIQ